MTFAEKLKAYRTERGISQLELAKLLGVSRRTIVGYEVDNRLPRDREMYEKIANIFNIDSKELYTESMEFQQQVYEEYGSRAKKQAEALTQAVAGLFAGGELDDEDMDAMMQAMQDAFWQAKKENKKHTPKKYRKASESDNQE